jgi:hypothetical protein
MAGAVTGWHVEANLVLNDVVRIMASDGEAIRLEVIDPLVAAPASRTLVDIDRRSCWRGQGRLGKTDGKKSGNNAFHTKPFSKNKVQYGMGVRTST